MQLLGIKKKVTKVCWKSEIMNEQEKWNLASVERVRLIKELEEIENNTQKIKTGDCEEFKQKLKRNTGGNVGNSF